VVFTQQTLPRCGGAGRGSHGEIPSRALYRGIVMLLWRCGMDGAVMGHGPTGFGWPRGQVAR
jgi:hypothetical protein